MTNAAPSIVLDETARRFELAVEGHVAHVEFERLPGGIACLHTIVPRPLEGRGIGGRLVKHVLDYAAAHQLKVRPDCSFVKTYIERHPEYQGLAVARDGDK